jgi:hypothetical protein
LYRFVSYDDVFVVDWLLFFSHLRTEGTSSQIFAGKDQFVRVSGTLPPAEEVVAILNTEKEIATCQAGFRAKEGLPCY